MRIISGKAGRLAIKVPSAVTRPTTDFVRQAIFSILGGKVDGARVLDLFAGSGAIGLEALSRGAASCVFVEQHRQAATVISENLTKSRLEGGRVVRAEVAPFLRHEIGSYDLIFADPPYAKCAADFDHVRSLLEGGHVLPRLAPGGWFIAEAPSGKPAGQAPGWKLVDHREYGGSAILLYAPLPEA
jgi:16S rRNA (guanine966-N2)-methyltransferase